MCTLLKKKRFACTKFSFFVCVLFCFSGTGGGGSFCCLYTRVRDLSWTLWEGYCNVTLPVDDPQSIVMCSTLWNTFIVDCVPRRSKAVVGHSDAAGAVRTGSISVYVEDPVPHHSPQHYFSDRVCPVKTLFRIGQIIGSYIYIYTSWSRYF